MKKFVKIIALVVVVSLLPVSVFASGYDNINIEELNREEEILQLLDCRQLLISSRPVNLEDLNEIDIRLNALGVTVLSETDVAKQFPEAKASISKFSVGEAVSTRGVTIPDSEINYWTTYRVTNFSYNGKRYNIQKVVAQPLIEEESPLWDEAEKGVNFSVNWEAGVTNLVKAVASVGVSQLAPKTATVYDILSSVWSGLKPVSDIDASEVTYRFENKTTAMFSYVRLESQTDYEQELVHIGTKCVTNVAFIVDVDSWSQNGDGVFLPYPDQKTGTKTITSEPSNYGSTTRACYAYENYAGGSLYDRITSIKISGPESKTVVTISPCLPEYPYGLEF